ncbi:zinc finger protein 37 [Stylonychia lemnae]|uniref:Zinc finger protein 37 n=1 Tax=Stylonychia lemnae TaxID=5949 RepID=A0A077ZPX6_STYLE|nr:zinc finger protein 37 [Stylonychia lemnae]|eukprot:CDW71514.1 zinc finger protein 37 [Stylonychia lemnae]
MIQHQQYPQKASKTLNSIESQILLQSNLPQELIISDKSKSHLVKNRAKPIHKCPHSGCSKFFSEKGNLQVHQRSHTGEKPFKCNFCKSCFSSTGNRKDHENRHTKRRPHQCKICKQSYYRKYQLVKHSERKHPSLNQSNDSESFAPTQSTHFSGEDYFCEDRELVIEQKIPITAIGFQKCCPQKCQKMFEQELFILEGQQSFSSDLREEISSQDKQAHLLPENTSLMNYLSDFEYAQAQECNPSRQLVQAKSFIYEDSSIACKIQDQYINALNLVQQNESVQNSGFFFSSIYQDILECGELSGIWKQSFD